MVLKSFRQGHSLPTAKSLQQKHSVWLGRPVFSGVRTLELGDTKVTSCAYLSQAVKGKVSSEAAGRQAEQNHLILEDGIISRFSLREKEPARSELAGQQPKKRVQVLSPPAASSHLFKFQIQSSSEIGVVSPQ